MPTKSCPICAKRRGKRHCPGLARSRWAAQTETIRAQCCDEQQRFIAALALFFCRFAAEQKDVRDADLLAALDSLARGYQTLESGLYYEQPPDAVAARALYAAARDFLEQYSQQHQQERGSSLRPGEVLRALVFLRRLGQRESNGRPLTRTFLNFLRAQLPAEAQATTPSAPPLIVPGR